MLSTDRDALLCDLAETYHIYSFDQVPLRTLAILACGLRDNSRIIMKLSGNKLTFDQMIEVSILDMLKVLLWMQTEDGHRGRNRPESILSTYIESKKDNETMGFASPEDFERARQAIIEGRSI